MRVRDKMECRTMKVNLQDKWDSFIWKYVTNEICLPSLSSVFHRKVYFYLPCISVSLNLPIFSQTHFMSFYLVYMPQFVLLIDDNIPDIGLAVRVFANRPGDLGSIPGRVIPKTQKMVLDASLLNTQHYRVRIKGKVEQSRERSSVLPYTLV